MTKQILLVDDDPLLRRSLVFNLERTGYRASTAANAEDALALARRDRPDLVLLDIGSPGMDGLEALHHFRSWGEVPIIFLTGRRRELDEILGLELGADDSVTVTKPFDLDVLLSSVYGIIGFQIKRIKPERSALSAEPERGGSIDA
jgi:DNA-binding response OmpR family regulator